MADKAQVEFYNAIYKARPSKWADIDRDYTAFKTINSVMDEPGRMLDIGCGNGHTLAFFKSQWPGTQYTGVDISDVALDLAKKRIPEAEFYEGIPLGRLWDIIVLMGVAEHFPLFVEELRYIGTCLVQSGYLYLEAPNCLAYSNDQEEGFRQTHRGSGQKEWHWKRATWEQALDDAGFEIVRRSIGPFAAWEFIWILRRSDWWKPIYTGV